MWVEGVHRGTFASRESEDLMYSGSPPPSVRILSPYFTWLQVGFPPLSHPQRFCWSSRNLWESVIADLPLGFYLFLIPHDNYSTWCWLAQRRADGRPATGCRGIGIGRVKVC